MRTGGSVDVGPLRRRRASGRPARTRRRARRRPAATPRSLGAWAASARSSMIALSGGRSLGREQRARSRRGVSSATRDPVDRVGRQGDDPAAAEDLDRLGAAGGVVRDDAGGHAGRSPADARPRRAPPRGRGVRAASAGRRGRARSISCATPSSASGGARYRAAARTAAGAVGIAAPWPAAAIISRSLNWSPIARTCRQRDAGPPREPADADALRHARGEELEEAGVADRHLGPAGEPLAGRRPSTRLGDRVRRRRRGPSRPAAGSTPRGPGRRRPGAEERRVVLGARIVGLDRRTARGG